MGCGISVSAAPKLRLTSAAVGPVVVATGANAATQKIDAFNAGDGALSLSVTANVPWLSAAPGEPADCALRPGLCTPIGIEFSTSALPKGLHTAVLTISDPNALDAPQTVTVTVQVGGAVPDRMDFNVMPGGSQEQVIRAGNLLGVITTTESGGNWLSVPSDGGGSFRFNYNYRVVVRHLEGMEEGEYKGSLNVINSRLEEENKLVPVTLKITSGPILSGPAQTLLRMAEGSAAYSAILPLGNTGGGPLAISEVLCTVESGEWLSAEVIADGQAVRLKTDPAGLAIGHYMASVEIVSNAANSPFALPILLEIMPPAAPAIDYSSVSDLFSTEGANTLAPGMLMKLRGTQLIAVEPAQAEGAPYPQTLAGARLTVNGLPAALLSASAEEMVFQIPYDVEPGAAVLQPERDGQPGNQVEVSIAPRAPIIAPAPVAPYARAAFEDGVLAVPESLGGRPAIEGEAVVLSLIGLGRTEPAVETGAAPEDVIAVIPESVQVSFGAHLFNEGVVAPAESAQLIPGSPGRYAVRVVIPPGTIKGDRVAITVTAGGLVSNKAYIAIQ